MNKPTSTRLGQILLDKGLVTVEQLDIAVKEQQKRRQLLDPFDSNLGVSSSLGEILIELGFIDRLQLKRGLNWQLMLRKMAIVMSFCAPLMTASYAAAATAPRPTFTNTSVSSAPKVTPTFIKTSSSSSSAPTTVKSSSSIVSSSSHAASSSAASTKSSIESDSFSGFDSIAPKMPEKISVSTSYDRVQLSWNDATDEAGVTHYKIYRDQVQIDTLDGYQTTYIDFNVAPGKTYLYGISASDDAGNWSTIKSVFAQTTTVAVTSSSQASSVTSISNTSSSQAGVSTSSTSSKTASVASSSSSSAPGSVKSSSSSKVASSSIPTSIGSSNSSKAASSVTSIASSVKAASSAASSASSSKVASSVTSSASSSAASSSGITVAGPVNFTWTAPSLRENGNLLDITEVGGYELRYRKVSDTTFTYVTISDAWKNYYNFSWLDGSFVFQIAAFDKNGNYSNFVDLTPQ